MGLDSLSNWCHQALLKPVSLVFGKSEPLQSCKRYAFAGSRTVTGIVYADICIFLNVINE